MMALGTKRGLMIVIIWGLMLISLSILDNSIATDPVEVEVWYSPSSSYISLGNYSTIQSAINDCTGLNGSWSETETQYKYRIWIDEGDYSEELSFQYRYHIKLSRASEEDVTLQGDDTYDSGDVGITFKDCANIKVEYIYIKEFDDGIHIGNASNHQIEVLNCQIEANDQHGVHIEYDAFDFKINKNSIITSRKAGVRFTGSIGRGNINFNNIYNNGRNGVIVNGKDSGSSSQTVTIRRNIISTNGDDPYSQWDYRGIHLVDCRDVYVYDNNINYNAYHGIGLDDIPLSGELNGSHEVKIKRMNTDWEGNIFENNNDGSGNRQVKDNGGVSGYSKGVRWVGNYYSDDDHEGDVVSISSYGTDWDSEVEKPEWQNPDYGP